MTVSQKIIEDYGTITHFCRKHGLNYHTFKVFLYGNSTSAPKAKLLMDLGYIKDASELKRKRKSA